MHVARIVRGEMLRLREMAFVEAARALGVRPARMILVHLLPNTWGPILVTLTLRIPLAILSESMLGFVGLGVKSPLASWGTLAHEGWSAMRFYPHLILFPSAVLFLTILALNFVGEALRDYFDPKGV
jgi:oligopeptide transport system permease protein